MSLSEKIIALLTGFSEFQVRGMTPVQRLLLAAQCRRLLRAADPPVLPPRVPPAAMLRRRSGVLALLEDGERSS